MSSHSVGVLLADLALIVVCARLFGALARRIGQPPVVGEIVSGILLGPTLLGQHLSATVFPQDVRTALVPLADIGLVLFMFSVGYELDHRIARRGTAASVVAGSTVLPLLLGFALATWLATRHAHHNTLAFVLFIGLAMAVTAFPVLARIVVDRGITTTRIGTLALSSAAVDDVVAWSLLAVVVSLAGGQSPWLVLLAVPLVAVLFLVIRPLLARLLPRCGVPGAFTVLAVGMTACAASTELIGLHFIFGAFLFGVITPRHEPAWLRTAVVDRLTSVGGQLLMPIFFVIAGLNLNLSHLATTDFVEFGAIVVVAVGGKLGGAFAGASLSRLPRREAFGLAVLMNTRGLTEIVVLTVGLQIGVLDSRLYSLMIIMALLTTAMAGPLLGWLRIGRGVLPHPVPGVPDAPDAIDATPITQPPIRRAA